MGDEKENLIFFSVNGGAQGFTDVIEYIQNSMGFSDSGCSHHHSIIHKLTVRDGGAHTTQMKAFKRVVCNGFLDIVTKTFYHNEKNKGG